MLTKRKREGGRINSSVGLTDTHTINKIDKQQGFMV